MRRRRMHEDYIRATELEKVMEANDATVHIKS